MAGRPAVAPSALVVGDVHGCADELRALLDQHAVDRVVLVGDLYTKGPDPAGVWRLIRDRHLEAVRGNHDQRLIDVIAGTRPKDRHGAEVVAILDKEDTSWREHLHHLPFHLQVGRFTVVHASVHPTGDLAQTRPFDFLVRRHLDGDGERRWWESYRSERPIVFGHDAIRGLVAVRHEGRLHVVGLDSGCVYGGALSGLLLPDEELVAQPAAQVYRPV